MRHFGFRRNRPKQQGLASLDAREALSLFSRTREGAIHRGEKILSTVASDLRQGERGELQTYWEALPFYFDVVKTTDAAARLVGTHTPAASQEATPQIPSYLVSSFFLAQCHAFLTGNDRGYERLHLVTGIKVNGRVRTLDRMVRVDLDEQSELGAVADQHALQRALVEMDEWGHSLHGLFHSHPGLGALSTRPSSTDLGTQHRYEQGGYPLIGAIFVKDGYVRFFSHQPFTITVSGKGVVQHEEHVYKIQNVARQLPNTAPDANDVRRSVGERSAGEGARV
jgi:hypothetical protein